ncbi:ketopantoate reductase family protein [Chondrinema litorale]|uniref:ketopantoate reductase family protein n=1 Tax=Chondrinema litorale TaxID=2994555 RepID=UPI002543CC7A|nr:2-dehydropantoate 2-reductase [Chondrinema litorale]UZR95259.1 2-dehydropantoate 2-reductase [Chondrinema litorale]
MNTPIYILGAGAIGKALAVNLILAEKNVVLLRASQDDIPETTTLINCRYKGEELPPVKVKSISLSLVDALDGIILVATKAYGNEAMAQKLKGKTGSSPLVILQNGLGVEAAFIDADFPELYRCVLFATSESLSETEISYKPVAASTVGSVKSKKTDLQQLVQAISTTNFAFTDVDNIQKIAWQKTIINCVFNSICPLLNVDNGIFQRDNDVLQLAKEVIVECLQIAKASNINLSQEKIEERLLFISKSSDGQLISTLQDINNHRETEIDSLNLAIVSIAEKLGLQSHVTRTKMLGELIKIKSKF